MSSEQTKESTNAKGTNEIEYKRQVYSISFVHLTFVLSLVCSLDICTLFRFFTWRVYSISFVHLTSVLHFACSLDVCTLFCLFTWRLYSIPFVHLTFVLYFVFSLDVCTLFRLFTWRVYSIPFVHLTFVLYFFYVKWTNEIEYKRQVNKRNRVHTSGEQTK
jgi:hypothetical protein